MSGMRKFGWRDWVENDSTETPKVLKLRLVSAHRCLALLRKLFDTDKFDDIHWIGTPDGRYRLAWWNFFHVAERLGRLPKEIVVAGPNWAYKVEWPDIEEEEYDRVSDREFICIYPYCELIPCARLLTPEHISADYDDDGVDWFSSIRDDEEADN